MLKGSNYEGKIKMSTRGTDYAMKNNQNPKVLCKGITLQRGKRDKSLRQTKQKCVDIDSRYCRSEHKMSEIRR